MTTVSTIFVLTTLFCLAFKTTRLLGVICGSVLFLLYPIVTAVMRALASVTLIL
jgi:hypothetical protein